MSMTFSQSASNTVSALAQNGGTHNTIASCYALYPLIKESSIMIGIRCKEGLPPPPLPHFKTTTTH